MRIGVDLVDIGRIERIVEKHPAFPERLLSRLEYDLMRSLPKARSTEFLAGRIAVKESVLKALGTGIFAEAAMTQIETLQEPSGEPVLHLRGRVLEMAVGLGLQEYRVSISHESGMAIAFAVLL